MGSIPPGGIPLVPGMGGGMHMGPNDPLFAGQMRQPARGAGLPPGARWDPIRPPGMEVGRSSACNVHQCLGLATLHVSLVLAGLSKLTATPFVQCACTIVGNVRHNRAWVVSV